MSIDNNKIQRSSHLQNTMFCSEMIATVKDLVRMSYDDKELEQLVHRGMKRVMDEVRDAYYKRHYRSKENASIGSYNSESELSPDRKRHRASS